MSMLPPASRSTSMFPYYSFLIYVFISFLGFSVVSKLKCQCFIFPMCRLFIWTSLILMAMLYRVPRMSYIKNADFVHLQNVDRNLNSRKSYGVLRVHIDELFIFFFSKLLFSLNKFFCLLMFLS